NVRERLKKLVHVSLRFPVLLSGSADHLRRASGLLDLLQGRLRKLVGFHRDLTGQLAGSEHLEAVARLANDAEFYQSVGCERIAFELLQPSQIDDCELLLENVGEPALGQAAMERHLAALKSAHALETCAGVLSL